MGNVFSSFGGSWVVGIILAALYAGYRAILPKPLADIPYNRDAASKLFGDVPEMMGYVFRTGRIFCWLTSLTTRHQSPIVQAFIKPMSLPWVVVTDPLESQDILLRRTKEFDRSGMFGDIISGIAPNQHIQFVSADARFKNSRNLINHLMAPSFIAQVSGPHFYEVATTMIKIWQLKCDMAGGRPFNAHHDLTFLALDAIFAACFGHPKADGNTIRRLEAVSQWKPVLPAGVEEPVSFPEGEVPNVFAAALTLANSVTDTQLSPAPRLTSWVMRKFPFMRRAKATKDKYIRDKVDAAVELIHAGDNNPTTGLHSVLLRERDVAQKEGRAPYYHSPAIADEFFGFMLAGHDTSATTVAWGVKFLTDNQHVQTRLRSALRNALPAAAAEKRDPSYNELARAHIPYLDAFIEETLRHANTIAFVVRTAMQDTTVLGRHIPKGTDVFLMANGAGYLEPNIPVQDSTRSTGARASQGKALTSLWDDGDISEFKPERWLTSTTNERGEKEEAFDPMAGPMLAFGLGPRGCFGRKFAMLEMKMLFSLMVWNFELLETPKELGGYEAVQRFAREPVKCFVRLGKARW
ncbi:cytochrome P450 [Podospora aff. communis PSN243]|uniref:Cytochrome P450 n=1 Tax=Podospora aff. communis PSN243 TaxID=3040156 RepID=A0AAV9GJ18_9PEZI|nr:cytochrome P450 [Podospora aff. communis PSN243]